ncbi:MAG TPA: hypothetical protein VMV43_01745 [Candidatus Nanopelagicaceae bacterium]|nr:hypothetical protein [Candidatus Nanopelagicaceae bacterium]
MVQQDSENQKENKLKVEIYVPLNVCACQWEQFMNLVFQVITPYNNYISFDTKNLDSEEARRLNLHGNSIVIDGKEIVKTSFALKKKLPEILKTKQLI